MSKPATQNSTAPPSNAASPSHPIEAANGDPRRHRRQQQRRPEPEVRQAVKRFVYEYAHDEQQHRHARYSGQGLSNGEER